MNQIQRMSYEERRSSYAVLLARLSQIENAEDDYIAEYFFERADAIAIAMRDQAYLDALDSHHLDGGFANMVCGSYRRSLRHAFARDAYARNPARKRFLLRCFDSAELEKRLLEKPSVKGSFPRAGGVQACDVDKTLSDPAVREVDVHRLLERMSKANAQSSWHLTAYFAFRLREKESERVGRLVLQEVARELSSSRPPQFICRLIARAEIESPICGLLQRQQRVPRNCVAPEVEEAIIERLQRCASEGSRP